MSQSDQGSAAALPDQPESPRPTQGERQSGEAHAESYDELIPRLIPGYTSLARLAVAVLAVSPAASPRGSAVLVAGCGTGAELLEAHRQRPDWQLTALDPSATMLAVAQSRLADTADIEMRCCRVEDLEGEARFDAALAILVLQSLPDDGTKLNVLTALARQLRGGAQLLLVDLMLAERSPLQDQVSRAWTGFQRASGIPEEVEALRALGRNLHPISAARLAALLDAAGFGDPALIFQALDFAGYLIQRRC